MLKAIIFDLFETLITERNSHKITGKYIADMLGISVDEYKGFTHDMRDERYRGRLVDFRDLLTFIMQSLGKPYSNELINKIAKEREAAKADCFENISSDILSLLREIKKRNIKIGLISNASGEEIKGYENSEIKPFIDEAIFSCNLGYIKPEPEIYKEACKRLKVYSDECIYVGDGGSRELVGAKSVRMQVLCATWFTSKYGYAPPEGFAKVQSPKELILIIDKYMRGSMLPTSNIII